jgi:hypothetical protein
MRIGLGLRSLRIVLAVGAGGIMTGLIVTPVSSGVSAFSPEKPTELQHLVVRLPLPRDAQETITHLVYGKGQTVPAQVAPPGLGDDPSVSGYVVSVLPRWDGTEPLRFSKGPRRPEPTKGRFQFVEKPQETLDVIWKEGDVVRPVLQYVFRAHDPNDHYFTFKPFHHVYDPVQGATLLTSGAVKTAKEGLFPHHRGLFFGYNRISYDNGQTADIWHGTNGVFSQHERFLERTDGPIIARHRAQIHWYGRDGQAFAQEEREVSVFAVEGGTLIEWSSLLTTKRPKVRLDGDPQHAGFHFRAAQEVASNGKQNTYYLRPDGKGKIGETRNWDAKKPDPRTVDLPWNALSFVVGGKRYTVLRIVHPANPGPARGSERDYGRFGDYFEYDLTPDKPLHLRYRLWVQCGEMTVEQCKALAAAFRTPPAMSWESPR